MKQSRPLTLLLTCLETALTMSDCEWLPTIDEIGDESWDSWIPGSGSSQPSPGFKTFQVLQDKTNSINMNPGLQFGHRLLRISVWVLGLYRGNLTAIFEVSPTELMWCLGPFLRWDSRCAVTQDFPVLLILVVGQNPIWWCILCCSYFSFLFIFVYWKQARQLSSKYWYYLFVYNE